ncbi:hypothetical protein JX266_012654 [Neoarthrinium moseri]|nr:hypothetical protein JX266_012654 [Neoarthrinium moseri]
MTGTASAEAAPAHDNPDPVLATTTAAQSSPGALVAHGKPLLDPLDTAGLAKPGLASDSDSDLTPIRSDEDDPIDDPFLHDASTRQDASDADPDSLDDRPAKRPRLSTPPPNGSQLRKPKPISPPWKKFEADRPTTFTEDGKRRSGRTNATTTPQSEQSPRSRRPTRAALHEAKSTPSSKANQVNGYPRTSSSSTKAQSSASKAVAGKRISTPSAKAAAKTSSRRRPSISPPPPTAPTRASARQRSTRNLRDSYESSQNRALATPESPRSTRIRLRVRPSTIPLVHPAQVNVLPGQTVPRPKIGETFTDYIQRAPDIDIKDGGWQDLLDDGPAYTDEQAEKDARILLRVEEESQPGGMLSGEKCALLVPDPADEPARQWAHYDHLVKAMSNFRKLMYQEHQRHRASAKRLAEACRDEWLRRQPKTAEQIEAEERVIWIGRYKTVMKAFTGTWENVRTEINRRRFEEWEAAEQRRIKTALNEAVSKSELQLQARRARFDSETLLSDEDEDEDEDQDLEDDISEEEDIDELVDGDARTSHHSGSEDDNHEHEDDDEDNMSSSDDEEDAKSVASDAGLTQEQLRQKYANIPNLPTPNVVPVDAEVDGEASVRPTEDDETSDESVDMDDDLGSSDDDMDSGEDEDGSEDASADEDEGEEEPSGLLGMLFGKSELKKIKQDVVVGDAKSEVNDTEMADAPPLSNGHTPQLSTHTGINEGEEEHGQTIHQSEVLEDKAEVNGHEERLPQTSTEDGTPHDVGQVDPPTDPYQANKPDAVATIPKPLQPETVGMEVIDAVENLQEPRNGDVAMANGDADTENATLAVPSVELTAPQIATNASPATDGVTQSASRDESESPRTSDTRPSEVETSSSVVRSGASRSSSPSTHGPKTEVPFLLRGTLREYQHYGLDWLAGLYQNNTNGILADEMGLGKTIQTISLLAHLACHHEVWGPHLVIVPTSVMLNWEMEFKKWCPGFKVLSYYGSIEERKRKRQGWKTDDMWNVCITSYQIVLQDNQVFKRRQWHYMILDEAHNIKNFKSKRWQTLLGFNTRARLLLTGTPLQNNLTELWSLLFFLMPSENGVGGFADLAEFQDWFHKPESQILESGREQMDDEARAIISKLHKVLRPYLLRRLKADVEKQMPAKYEHVEFCRLSRRQRELYDGFLARTDTREALASGNYISVINCLMQLRKVCNHPDLFVERPIMTSFRQRSSVVEEYAPISHLFRHRLLADAGIAPSVGVLPIDPMSAVSLDFLNLVPTLHEDLSATDCRRVMELTSHNTLMKLRETQKERAHTASTSLDPSTAESNLVYLESAARWGRFEELQHSVYLNALRRQQQPIYGKRLREFLTIGVNERPHKPRPRVPARVMAWFEEDSTALKSMVLDLDQRAESMKSTISKFACITPAVITRDIDQFVLGSKGVAAFSESDLRLSAPVRYSPFMPKEAPLDPWHEARMRLSIQFPDKRLLQYDCGKLQALDRLLRKLQTGGHRALIFTQMTKVLDILEQFLNIHGHKYLRLDGATKVEQRQILTDRFNNDPRILCFILSTRSGGLGINLTGADTVIFYDQDWNPAMDKQCQDRCHRIGQTRDVHIYRLVSEHTIEANILRKASQKQMLDDVVIQEGGFTTDYFNKLSVHDVMKGVGEDAVEDVVGDAMDRVLGTAETGGERAVGRVLEQAEDREDVAAAHVAEKEIQDDDADFNENAPTASASGTSSARQGTPLTRDVSAAPGRSNLGLFEQSADAVEIEHNAWGEQIHTVDDFMLGTMAQMLEGTVLELPKDKKKGKNHKKGKDHRKR